MWDWIDQGAGLWGLLALPVALVVAIPGIVELFITVRDWNRSTSEIHESLRTTKGRVRGDGLHSRAIGSDNSFEAIVTIDDQPYPACDHIYERLTQGSSLVVVGDAGAGKSELLEELHRSSYRVASEAADPLIEVVSLAALSTRGTHLSLREGAVRVIAGRYRISRRAVRGLIAEARIIVAFDGLDEVPNDLRLEVARQLAEVSRQVPIVVSTRLVQVRSDGSGEVTSTPDLLEAGGLQRANLQPLSWAFVEAALLRRQAPVPLATDRGASQLQNPLLLQIVLFLWRRKELDESEFLASLRAPRYLLRHFVLGAVPIGRDKALRFVGLMAADQEKSTEAPFKVFPVQLAGRAFTLAMLVGIAAVTLVGAANELWVTAPVLIAGIVSGSPYPNSSIVGRALTGWADELPWRLLPFALVYGFVVANAIRVISWSVQTGGIYIGSWEDYFAAHVLLLGAWVAFFTVFSPMQLRYHPYTYTPYMQQHVWPVCALFAASILALVVMPAILDSLLPLVVYLGLTCAYLAVSAGLAWRITGVPPWKWNSLVQDLESRGIVTRTGSTIKLVHREIEEVILHNLATDKSTPRSLWASFSADWEGLLINNGPLMSGDAGDDVFSSTIRGLARRDAWSTQVASMVFCRYQWVSIDPAAAQSMLKLHLRLVPFSSLRVLLPDALDRTGGDGVSLALQLLSRRQKNVFAMHWPLRVVERHLLPVDLVQLYRDLEQRHSGSLEILYSLRLRRLNLLLSDLESGEKQALLDDIGPLNLQELEGPVAAKAAIVLESARPDIVLARRLLAQDGGSLHWARYAQSLLLDKSPDEAKSAAAFAVSRLSGDAGYLTTLEVMVTAFVATGSPEVGRWLEQAYESGLRIKGRPGLRRNLSVPVDSLASRLFDS